MNEQQIDQLPAGREMDALVEEKIFGRKAKWERETRYPYPDSYKKAYSGDMTAAWKVVEEINEPLCLWNDDNGLYHIHFGNLAHEGFADIAPLTICRAALKSVREDDEVDSTAG